VGGPEVRSEVGPFFQVRFLVSRSWPGEEGLPDRMPSPLRDGGVYHPDPSLPG
jgi:hypothetical protein